MIPPIVTKSKNPKRLIRKTKMLTPLSTVVVSDMINAIMTREM